MTHPIRSLFVVILLPAAVAACAGTPSMPTPVAGAPRFVCPDGTSFTTSVDPGTHVTGLFLEGRKAQTLQPVPDPMGGVLTQNADYQLRPGINDTVQYLTDRSTTVRQACTRAN